MPSASVAASGSGPGARRELAGGRGCRPWIIRRPGPRKRHAGPGQLRFSSPAPGKTWLPGAPALCLDVTLSDAGGHRERAHSRRYGRVTLPPVYRRSPHRTGLFVRSGQAEIRTQLLCSSAASYEAAGAEWSGNQRDSVPRPPPRAAHRQPGPGQCQRHSPRCTSFPIPRQYPPGQPTLYRVLPRPGSPERSAARLPSYPAGNICPAIMGRQR